MQNAALGENNEEACTRQRSMEALHPSGLRFRTIREQRVGEGGEGSGSPPRRLATDKTVGSDSPKRREVRAYAHFRKETARMHALRFLL